MTKIAPSILASNFAKLGTEVMDAANSGADYIHVDVMDGHFVPEVSFGPLVIEAIKPLTKVPLDVHLMIEEPDKHISRFKEVGAHILTVHQEACTHLHRTIQNIKEHNMKAGVAINPATTPEVLKHILPFVDLVLVMTVNPGFGGQVFIPETLKKVEILAKWRKEMDLHFEIEVDGGVNKDTAKSCVRSGVDVLVAGSAFFGRENRKQAITDIQNAIKDGEL